MFKNHIKKLTAFVLTAFMFISVMGTTLVEAHPHDNWPNHEYHHRYHHEPQKNDDKGHSTGEVTTAAIAGAIIGAIVAKNT
ncbi:hypothetical protein [Pectinatus sottacetonis]|uniref:hypothetical protein n=1 Tax=Pectinatus sottacetonis TaxID=1002795 RepID=UPI0018C5E4AD|nr:hypothetical protein [Pectinatus sottacetonis]